MPNVFLLKDETNKDKVEIVAKNDLYKVYDTPGLELTEEIITDMAERSFPDYFYVVKLTATSDTNIIFDFTFRPPSWDSKYLHIWNNGDTVRLYNRNTVLENPAEYTDEAFKAGRIELKNKIGKIFNLIEYDIIYLSYDEFYADENYKKLKDRFPRAKRLHNIKGIHEAHKAAARWAQYDNSDMFYVVDADALIVKDFDFSYNPPIYDLESVHVWHSKNPINDLEYGYGGIKLFPTKLLTEAEDWGIDFTTTVSKNFKVMPTVSNITAFNTDPFSTWRSAFRECVKLASSIIPNQNNEETQHRLDTWCTVGSDRPYGEFSIMGANEGRDYSNQFKSQKDMLNLINDFEWLEKRFSS